MKYIILILCLSSCFARTDWPINNDNSVQQSKGDLDTSSSNLHGDTFFAGDNTNNSNGDVFIVGDNAVGDTNIVNEYILVDPLDLDVTCTPKSDCDGKAFAVVIVANHTLETVSFHSYLSINPGHFRILSGVDFELAPEEISAVMIRYKDEGIETGELIIETLFMEQFFIVSLYGEIY